MKYLIKIISVITLLLIFSGCFSSRDLEYDYYDDCQDEIVIIEYVPVPSPPLVVVVPLPVEPIIEEPKVKYRTGGEVSRSPSQNRMGTSYQSRDSDRNSSSVTNSGRKERHTVEKRTRKRR